MKITQFICELCCLLMFALVSGEVPQHDELPLMIDPFGFLSKDGGLHGVKEMLTSGAETLSKQMGQVHSGFQEAGKVAKIVGEDLSHSISKMVNNHISPGSVDEYGRNVGESNRQPSEGMLTSLLKMIGLDTNQLALMALNILIFVAEMITASIMGDDIPNPAQSRSADSFLLKQLLDYNSAKLDDILLEMQDPSLPRTMIGKIAQFTGDKSPCVQMLVCKTSPFVWGMQRYLKNTVQAGTSRAVDPDVPETSFLQDIYNSMPNFSDFLEFSTECENQFSSCHLLSLKEVYFN